MARSLLTPTDPAVRTVLNVRSLHLTDDQFLQLCSDNGDLQFELSAEGELIIMPPPGAKTGWRELKIGQRLANWADRDGTGITFGSGSGFKLPNGAVRGPDAAWMPLSRWQTVSPEQQEKLAPVCPDFVIELRSPSDRLSDAQKKMAEYMNNGARLGWLLDPLRKRAYVYRPGAAVERLENPEFISGEDVLSGFKFNFQEIL